MDYDGTETKIYRADGLVKAIFVPEGEHTIYINDRNGCGIVEETITIVGIPKFFTPNGDGTNEFWQVKGINNQFQANSLILIFDRYGKLITKLNPLGPGWDGRYNGANMPASDYWFKVELEDGRTFTSQEIRQELNPENQDYIRNPNKIFSSIYAGLANPAYVGKNIFGGNFIAQLTR